MPPIQDVHIDKALSDFAVGVLQDTSAYVGGGFFPFTDVDKLSDKYHVIPRNAFARGDAKPRGSNQESAGFDFELSEDLYSCVPYAMHADVDRNKLLNSDNPRMYEEGAIRLAIQNLLLTHEIAWTAKFFKDGVWGKDVTGVASSPGADQYLQWNDTNSDPEQDIDEGVRTILVNGGLPPNKLLLGYDVWLSLKRHPKIVDRVKHTSKEPVTTDIVARLFGLERIVVAKGTKATNAVGQAETYDFVQGKHALLAYCGENGSGDLMPSAGRIFAWRGMNPGALVSGTLAAYRIEKPLHKSNRYEVEASWDHKMTGQHLGYFFKTAVA